MPIVAMRAVNRRSARGLGVTPTLFAQMALFRNTLLQNMREEAPVNKNPQAKNRGALRKSLRAETLTDGRRFVFRYSALEYVKFVIHGTRPHRIEAKPGGVLAIPGPIGVSSGLPPISYLSRGGAPGKLGRKGGPSIFRAPGGYAALRGGVVFLAFVNHPGTQPNNFAQRAYEKTLAANLPSFTKSLREAIAADLISAAMPA